MSSSLGYLGYKNITELIENYIHITFTNYIKQVGVHEKMTEMRSVVWMTNSVWLCIRITLLFTDRKGF